MTSWETAAQHPMHRRPDSECFDYHHGYSPAPVIVAVMRHGAGPMNKQHILDEIVRTAALNDGIALAGLKGPGSIILR